eukprot:779363-Prymnesium_polylepis.3
MPVRTSSRTESRQVASVSCVAVRGLKTTGSSHGRLHSRGNEISQKWLTYLKLRRNKSILLEINQRCEYSRKSTRIVN